MDDPKWLSDPRPRKWIEQRARELQGAMNLEIFNRWCAFGPLAQHQLIEEIVDRYLNVFWSYELIETIGKPPQIVITQYNGAIQE